MKIRVVPQLYYREYHWLEENNPVYNTPEFRFGVEYNFIMIRHSAEENLFCGIHIEQSTILRLQFDDVIENPEGDLIFSI